MNQTNRRSRSSVLSQVGLFSLAFLPGLMLVGCDDDDASKSTDSRADAGTGMMGDTVPQPAADEAGTQPQLVDIVATAQGAGRFTTLVAALTAGELVEVLKGAGPFTVFAPTDEAFAKLPAGTLENLLRPENKAQLQAILKYHVVAGKVLAADVVKLTSATTLEGSAVRIAVSGSDVSINESKVTQVDVMASNGVIHIIDAVLLPPAK